MAVGGPGHGEGPQRVEDPRTHPGHRAGRPAEPGRTGEGDHDGQHDHGLARDRGTHERAEQRLGEAGGDPLRKRRAEAPQAGGDGEVGREHQVEVQQRTGSERRTEDQDRTDQADRPRPPGRQPPARRRRRTGDGFRLGLDRCDPRPFGSALGAGGHPGLGSSGRWPGGAGRIHSCVAPVAPPTPDASAQSPGGRSRSTRRSSTHRKGRPHDADSLRCLARPRQRAGGRVRGPRRSAGQRRGRAGPRRRADVCPPRRTSCLPGATQRRPDRPVRACSHHLPPQLPRPGPGGRRRQRHGLLRSPLAPWPLHLLREPHPHRAVGPVVPGADRRLRAEHGTPGDAPRLQGPDLRLGVTLHQPGPGEPRRGPGTGPDDHQRHRPPGAPGHRGPGAGVREPRAHGAPQADRHHAAGLGAGPPPHRWPAGADRGRAGPPAPRGARRRRRHLHRQDRRGGEAATPRRGLDAGAHGQPRGMGPGDHGGGGARHAGGGLPGGRDQGLGGPWHQRRAGGHRGRAGRAVDRPGRRPRATPAAPPWGPGARRQLLVGVHHRRLPRHRRGGHRSSPSGQHRQRPGPTPGAAEPCRGLPLGGGHAGVVPCSSSATRCRDVRRTAS